MQTYWGGEFRPLLPIFEKSGILFRHPCPYTHQQQRRVEQKHHHIIDLSLTLLAQDAMPLTFWWDACVSSVFIINQLLTKVLANFQSPFKTLFGSKLDYSFFKVFGCSCYSYLRPYNSHKFSFRSTKCLFLGYSPTHKGYRCLSLSGQIYVAKSITFNENDFPYSTLLTQPNTPHQSFINKFICPSYVLPYCPPVSPPFTHLPTSSSQCHISYFVNMSNTFIATVTDTPMALTLPISNALFDNVCSSFSNSIIGSVSLPSCPVTSTTVPIVDNIVSTPCTHVV